jgi:hypothetical protein
MTTVQKYTSPTAAGAEIDRRAERYMAEHQCGYTEAWHAILGADKELANAYGQPAPRVARMATTDKRSQPAVPVSPADEREVTNWILRALQDGKASALPGALGQLAIEADKFAKVGMPPEEAARRAMGSYPHLVTLAKLLLADVRRNAPENKPEAGNAAGYAVHARAVVLVEKHTELDYRSAVGAVLSEDPDLKVRYAEVAR